LVAFVEGGVGHSNPLGVREISRENELHSANNLFRLELAMKHKRYEYKLHYLKLERGRRNEDQLVDALNDFGKEGWRLNRLYGEVSLRSITSWKGSLNLLLEREIQE